MHGRASISAGRSRPSSSLTGCAGRQSRQAPSNQEWLWKGSRREPCSRTGSLTGAGAEQPAPASLKAVPNGRSGRYRHLAQVVPAGHLEIGVKLIDERVAGGDFDLDDFLIAEAVQVLDQGTQAVAMRGDQHGIDFP